MEGVMVQPGKEKELKEIYPGIQGNSPTLQSNLAFLAQQQRIRAALQQQDPFALHRHTDSLMMSAVARQQLASSLGSSQFPFFQVGGLYAPSSVNRSTDFCPSTSGGSSNPLTFQLHKKQEPQQVSGSLTLPHSQAQRPATIDSKSFTSSSSERLPTGDLLQIPCQARGMSPDHNSLTAYFEIPRDIIHGQHLYCSHAGCRASGVKFRYCLYCRKPVTKQNFRSRHLHADDQEVLRESTKKRRLDELLVLQTTTDNLACYGPPHHLQSSTKPWRSTGDSPSLIAVPSKHNSTGAPKSVDHVGFRFVSSHEKFPEEEGPAKETTSTMNHHYRLQDVSDKMPSSPAATGRQCGLSPDLILEQWRSLLGARPSNLEGMDLWLSKVLLQVRSLPVRCRENIQNGDPRCSKWERLLYTHPNADDSGSKVTSWLVEVIQASCNDQH